MSPRGRVGRDVRTAGEPVQVGAQVEPGVAVERCDLLGVDGLVQQPRVVDARVPRRVAARGLLHRPARRDDEAEQSLGQPCVLLLFLAREVVACGRLLTGRPVGQVEVGSGQRDPGAPCRGLLRRLDRLREPVGEGGGVARAVEPHELVGVGRVEERGQGVLGVQLVVVQVDATRDQAAQAERAVDASRTVPGDLGIDQAAHGLTHGDDPGRGADLPPKGGERSELVPLGRVERPHRAVRVVGGAGEGIAGVQQCLLRGGRRGVGCDSRSEAVAEQEQGAVPLRGFVRDPGGTVGQSAGVVLGGRGLGACRRPEQCGGEGCRTGGEGRKTGSGHDGGSASRMGGASCCAL